MSRKPVPDGEQLELTYSQRIVTPFFGDHDPEEFVTRYDVTITLLSLNEDDEEEETEIGRILAHGLHASAAADGGYDIVRDVIDAVGGKVSSWFPLFNWSFFRNTAPRFRKPVADMLETHVFDHCTWDFLGVDEVCLKPGFEGKGYGASALNLFLDSFGERYRYAVLQPWPLQFALSDDGEYVPSDREHLQGRFSAGPRAALRSLRKHWKDCGFKQVAQTDLMLRDLTYGLPD